MNRYIIVNRTINIENRIKELETQLSTLGYITKEEIHAQGYLSGKIQQLREILSQSTPSIPEIEKAFDAGNAYCVGSHELFKQTHPNKKNYISNLKLDL